MSVTTVPTAGTGLHEFILEYTWREIAEGRPEVEVQREVWRLCQGKGRKASILGKEIDDAIAGASKWLAEHPESKGKGKGKLSNRIERSFGWWNAKPAGSGLKRYPAKNKWVGEVNHRVVEYAVDRIRKLDLCPKDVDSWQLSDLFAGINFPVCLAQKVTCPTARLLSDWQSQPRLTSYQFMVPNPCLKCGVGGGVKSDRNAGERIWLVIEFDQWELEIQAKLLVWLGRIWTRGLGMIVFSGSKSLHGWFSCVGKSESHEISKLFKQATKLGCDRAMRSSVQYARMPLGVNAKTGRAQEIIHFDEDALEMHRKKLVEEYE